MRRLLAVVAVLFLSACSDRHAQGPFSPFGSVTASSQDDSQGFWLSGYTWTLSDGVTTCTNVEDYNGIKDNDGTVCNGGAFMPWDGSNTEMFPVVEICRLLASGVCSELEKDRTFFVRKAGEIGVPNLNNGKYVLGAAGEEWWANAEDATYRIIVAITFTGGTLTNPVVGWDANSPKVLGYFDRVKKNAGPDLKLRFRISSSAFCDDPCVATAFDPAVENVFVLDENLDLSDNRVGLVGIKFPNLQAVSQQKINLIFERLTLDGQKCLEAAGNLQPRGNEVGPCYRVRTEPYIDLTTIPGYLCPPGSPADCVSGDLIEFGICYGDDESGSRLPKMWKWSYVKTALTELTDEDVKGGFMYCDPAYGDATGAPGLSGLRSRFMAAAASVLMPAPLHARRGSNLIMGGLADLSDITLVEAEDVQVNFTTPIAPGNDNTPLYRDGVFTIWVQCATGACTTWTAPRAVGTAVWDETHQIYQLNWKTPSDLPSGEYDARVRRGVDELLPGSARFSVRPNNVVGTSYLTINPGRTLPIKFFLSWLE
jgi:hypothetical protein